MNKGVAPCSENIWRQKQSSVAVGIGDGAPRPKPLPTTKRRQRNQLIKIWAARCYVCHRHFKNGDGLSQQTSQARVFQDMVNENFSAARPRNRAQFEGPENGPQIWSTIYVGKRNWCRFPVSILGLRSGRGFSFRAGIFSFCRALATWQWNDFLENEAVEDNIVAHSNIDETHVQISIASRRGAIAVKKGWFWRFFNGLNGGTL